MARSLHFFVNVGSAGYHPAAWLEPELPADAFIRLEHYQRIAAIAERGALDGLLFPDIPVQQPSIATAPAATDANTGYFLQIGAYKTSQDAQQQRARLALQGFESSVTQPDSGGISYYRVRIGPFSKFDEMNNVRQQLSNAGIDSAVIRFTKQ